MNVTSHWPHQLVISDQDAQDDARLASLERSTIILVWTLLCIDLLFIGLHALWIVLRLADTRIAAAAVDYMYIWNVSLDRGMPEFFNYAKLGLACTVLLMIYRRSSAALYLILASIVAYAGLEDSFLIHEQVGVALAGASFLPDVLRKESYVQVIYFAMIACLASLMLLGAWKSAYATHRRYARTVIVSLGVLAFFAVVIDFMHALIVPYSRIANGVLDLAEDGGEMLAVTLLCSTTLFIKAHLSRGTVVLGGPARTRGKPG